MSFKYIALANILKEVIERGRQLKTCVYHSKRIKQSQIPMAYSLLSFAVNNYKAIKLAQDDILATSHGKATNSYLMTVLIAELISVGKISGGGQLKKMIVDHQHLLPQLQKESRINKQTIQIRVRHKG